MAVPKKARRDRWGYDPKAHGAQCDICSLSGRTVVPSEIRKDSVMHVIAEAPGGTEEVLGWPLCGPSGQETDLALNSAGISRDQVSLCNVMCCRPPEASYDIHLRTLKVRNKERTSRGLVPLIPAHEACLPRLIGEIENANSLLLMGAYARKALIRVDEESNVRAKDRKEIDEEDPQPKEERIPGRGFPGKISVNGRESIPCMSSMHPAYVLRARRWTKVFRNDVQKAVRMAHGELSWIKPEMLFFPTPDQLEEFLDEIEKSGESISYDVETDGLQPTEVNLRCIGIGTKNKVTCIPFKSVQQNPEWKYSRSDYDRIVDMLLCFFRKKDGAICPQNGKYDYSVMQHCRKPNGELWFPGFEINRKVFDTAVAHHVAWSEWPHDLDFLISQYTDAPHHKGKNHDAWDSDRELHMYCMLDVSRTAEAAEHIAREPALHAQKMVFTVDHSLSDFCRGLGNIGMALNVDERDRLYEVQTQKMEEKKSNARKLAEEALGKAGTLTAGARELSRELNPGSYQQVGKILYDALGVEPAPEKQGGYTDTGALSTKSDTLYYLMDRGLPDVVERFLLEVIDYRGASKLRGTYCTVIPCSDGRVRPSWNPHVVVSGRLSCSDPNLLNLHRSIRSMYVASPGNVLIACDKRQQEIRAVTVLSRDQRWLEAIWDGQDLHKVNACDLLGIPHVDQVSKGHRQFTKTFVFAIQYLAGLKKAHQMIKNFVDPKTGERPYRTRSLGEISLCYRRFWNAHKAILQFHERNRNIWCAQGFLADVLHGRRRYFLDGGGDESIKEEQANYLIQTVSASDVNDAIARVLLEYPWGFAGPNTGVVHYCYDALVLEVPEHRALEIGARVTEIMHSKIDDMEFPVDLAIGKDYGNKTEYKKGDDGMWREAA